MAEHARDLIRLSDSDFDIAEGESDPRGWEVFASDGRKIGEVEELIGDTRTRMVHYLDCELDSKELGLEERRHAIIPIDYTRLDEDDRRVTLQGLSTTEVIAMPAAVSDITPEYERRFATGRPGTEGARDQELWETRMTRSEEELEVGKHEVETGEVVLRKEVETEHVSRPVTRVHEEVDIERRPAEGMQTGEAEFQEEEIRIPVREEELEVRKRPEVKEEVIVRKRSVAEDEEVEADLRRERIDVEEHGDLRRRDDLDEDSRPGRGRHR